MLNSGWVCIRIRVCVCPCVWHVMSLCVKGTQPTDQEEVLCPNLDTISVSRNVLHHNNDNVGKTGNTWLTTLYSDLLGVWQSVFHMMFVSHKQFQHGRVWCQDSSHIIRHCRTSLELAKKIGFFYLGLLTSACVLLIVSHRCAALLFLTITAQFCCRLTYRKKEKEVCGGVSTWDRGGKNPKTGSR